MPSSAKDVPFTAAFLAVKLADIGYVTVLYFIAAMIFAKVFNQVYEARTAKEYDEMPIWHLTADVLFHIFLVGVVAYFMRNLVGLVPSPLDGLAGFQHARLKELQGGFILAVLIFMFQQSLRDKITSFAKRVMGFNINK
jgi:hypothetical protein